MPGKGVQHCTACANSTLETYCRWLDRSVPHPVHTRPVHTHPIPLDRTAIRQTGSSATSAVESGTSSHASRGLSLPPMHAEGAPSPPSPPRQMPSPQAPVSPSCRGGLSRSCTLHSARSDVWSQLPPPLRQRGEHPIWEAYLERVYGAPIPSTAFPFDLRGLSWVYHTPPLPSAAARRHTIANQSSQLPPHPLAAIQPDELAPTCTSMTGHAWVGPRGCEARFPESDAALREAGFFVQVCTANTPNYDLPTRASAPTPTPAHPRKLTHSLSLSHTHACAHFLLHIGPERSTAGGVCLP